MVVRMAYTMLQVFGPCPAVDEDIVEEHDCVHEGQERRRRVSQAERHNQELEMSLVRSEPNYLHWI